MKSNFKHTLGRVWKSKKSQDGKKFFHREYSDYQTYVEHQKAKLASRLSSPEKAKRTVAAHEEKKQCMYDRFKQIPVKWHGKRVLCLGARTGYEVDAFNALNCFAVGIDLNPGPENPWVLTGDFQNIRFPDQVVDVVYTNCMDHTFDAKKMLAEVHRVLVPEGTFILEAQQGGEKTEEIGFYESFWWSKPIDLIPIVERTGFKLTDHTPVRIHWTREQFTFKKI